MAREKILVVDDEPDVLDLCKQILVSNGYQVKGAGDGYQAIERARDESFDLLLVDINMPSMNGMETYREIKELHPDIIGVIITGYASIETAIEAVKLGFDGFVTKPFAPDGLNAAVAKALERVRLERENARLRALIPLFELSDAFMTTIDLDELLDQVVHTAQRETRADRVSLMLLDEATGELIIEAAVGLHLGVVAEAREKAGEGIAGWVAKRGEPLLLDDKAPLDPKIREVMKSDKVSSALCVPLKVKEDRVIGVLNLSKLEGAPFAQTDLELVSILCGQAAIAIENARLYREAKGRAEAMEQLNQRLWALQETSQVVSSTLTPKEVLRAVRENIASILPGAEPLFALVDEERQLIRPTPVFPDNPVLELVRRIIGVGLEDLALPLSELTDRQQEDFLAGKVRVVHKLSEGLGRLLSESVLAAAQKVLGIKVLVSAPLLSRGNLLGIMLVFARQEVGPPELELLKSLAQQAAIALENARLFEQEKRRATQLALIKEVGDKAASILDLDRLMQEMTRSIQEKFNYYNVALFLLDEERGEVMMQAVAGGFEHMASGEYRQALDEGIIGPVARTGNSWLANDVSKDPHYVKGFLGEVLTKSELCVPIKLGDKVTGTLDVQSIRLNDFDQADVAAMEAVADRVAIALENARLFQETERLKVFNESIVHGVAEAILMEDAQGILTFANPAAEELLGYTCEELIGLHWSALVPEDEREEVRQETAKRPQGILGHYETTLLSKGGQVIPVIVSARPLFEGGKLAGILSAFTEITELKQAEEELRQSLDELRRSFEGTVSALVSAIEMRDPYTAGHQRRVAQLACAIANEMNLSEEQIEGIRMAGLVHDIGKINVPAEILSKPGRLNDLEFGLIKTHCQVGHNILNGTIEFPWPVAQIVLQHHERMDGSGYPQGLSAEEIILEARVLAVADVVEAMSSHRPYRPPRGIDKALEEISQNRGILYDPEVVDACLKLFIEKGFTFE